MWVGKDFDLMCPEHVLVELEIVQNELKEVGVNVPMHNIARWSIRNRAINEQWAIKTKKARQAGKKPPAAPMMLRKWGNEFLN